MTRERIRTSRAGGIVGTTFAFWIKFLIPIAILGVVLVAPLRAIGELLAIEGEPGTTFLCLGALIAIGQLVTATFVLALYGHMRGGKIGVSACVRRGVSTLVPVFGVALVVGLLIAAGSFLVIPAFIFFAMWWVAVPAAVVEKLGVCGAMKRSAELTLGYRVPIVLIAILFAMLANGLASVVLSIVGLFSETIAAWSADIVRITFGSLVAIAPAVAYHNLRLAKEGLKTDDLAAVFD